MSATPAPIVTADPANDAARRRGMFGLLIRRPVAVGAMAILALIVLAGVFAPLLTPHSPTAVDLSIVLAPPSAEHLLGGDGSGRDNFSRLLYGARLSLLSALIALLTATLVGVPAGLIAGYRSGFVDSSIGWVANLLMSIPAVIALLTVIAGVGSSNTTVMIAFGLLLAPGAFQLTRSAVRGVRQELYVDAAKVSGLSGARILGRHVLAVVRPPLVIWATLMVGVVIVTQAGLQYLGVGDTTEASWGAMVNDAQRNIFTAGWQLYPPGIAIGVTALCFGLLGSELGDVLHGDRAKARRSVPKQRHPLAAPAADVAPVPGGGAAESGAPETLLEVRGLRVAYPSPSGEPLEVVHGIDLDVRRGEVLGLVGESGSGKSQTAFAILGLLPRQAEVRAASLRLDGRELTGISDRQRTRLLGQTMGYVPQEPMTNLDPSFTIGHQLVSPIRANLGLSRKAATGRALELLDRVGVADPRRVFSSYAFELSGGLAQRVLIAGAVSCEPQLLVADEPTTALDVTVQADVLDLLRDLQKELHMSVILVTHDLGVVADMCARVAVMKSGVIVETGDVEQIFRAPAHAYTAELIGSGLDGAAPREPVGLRTGVGA